MTLDPSGTSEHLEVSETRLIVEVFGLGAPTSTLETRAAFPTAKTGPNDEWKQPSDGGFERGSTSERLGDVRLHGELAEPLSYQIFTWLVSVGACWRA